MKETIQKVETLLNQLESFKNKKDFKKYGFSIAYKYNVWLKEVSDLKDFLATNKRSSEELLVLQLQNLGLSYVTTKGEEVERTKRFKRLIQEAINNLTEAIKTQNN